MDGKRSEGRNRLDMMNKLEIHVKDFNTDR